MNYADGMNSRLIFAWKKEARYFSWLKKTNTAKPFVDGLMHKKEIYSKTILYLALSGSA